MATSYYTVDEANKLIGTFLKDKFNKLTVDKHTLGEDKPFVFTSVDGKKIVKIVKMTEYMKSGLEKYLKLSDSKESSFCNICKLLGYEEIDDESGRVIIVMENCGQDLFDVLIGKTDITMNLRLSLQLSLDLFKQILCLQYPSDGTPGVVHGDITLANVLLLKLNESKAAAEAQAAAENKDGSLAVRIIDFDELPQIEPTPLNPDRYRVFLPTCTPFYKQTEIVRDRKTVTVTILDGISTTIERLYLNNVLFYTNLLMLGEKHNKYFIKNHVYFNIPNEFGLLRTAGNEDQKQFKGTIEYLHIIDIVSWCYIIATVIQRRIEETDNSFREENLFCCNALLLIVMNILLPNFDNPADIPIDCFGKPINKEYCDKVVNGLTALLRLFSENYIPSDRYTHSKLKLFFDLIQECATSDELIGRFKAILQANSVFYDEKFEFTEEGDVAITQTKFETVKSHITGAGGAGGAGGYFRKTNRRRRTTRHKKWRRSSLRKKSKKILKFKRMKNKTKLRRVLH